MKLLLWTFIVSFLFEALGFHLPQRFSSAYAMRASTGDDDEGESVIEDAFGGALSPLPTTSSKVNWGDQAPKNIKHGMNLHRIDESQFDVNFIGIF